MRTSPRRRLPPVVCPHSPATSLRGAAHRAVSCRAGARCLTAAAPGRGGEGGAARSTSGARAAWGRESEMRAPRAARATRAVASAIMRAQQLRADCHKPLSDVWPVWRTSAKSSAVVSGTEGAASSTERGVPLCIRGPRVSQQVLQDAHQSSRNALPPAGSSRWHEQVGWCICQIVADTRAARGDSDGLLRLGAGHGACLLRQGQGGPLEARRGALLRRADRGTQRPAPLELRAGSSALGRL